MQHRTVKKDEQLGHLACNEFRMLIRHRAVRKDKNAAATPGCYGIGLIYSPQTQPSIGCTSDSKIRTRDSNSKVQPLPAATHIYLSIDRSIHLSIHLSIYPSTCLHTDGVKVLAGRFGGHFLSFFGLPFIQASLVQWAADRKKMSE